jgi:hypothetical protein
MKSGAPAFGTPEYMRATQMTGQMARFYGLPLRSSGTCAANVPDGQAMWETANSLWAAVQSGTQHGLSRGRLARGRADREPREVRDGLRGDPADPALFRAAADRHDPADLALEAVAEVGRAGISSAARTRRSVTPRPSTSRSCRTGATSRGGRAPAASGRPSAPTGSTAPSSPSSSRRRWTPASARNWKTSSPAARPRAARPPTSESARVPGPTSGAPRTSFLYASP